MDPIVRVLNQQITAFYFIIICAHMTGGDEQNFLYDKTNISLTKLLHFVERWLKEFYSINNISTIVFKILLHALGGSIRDKNMF